MTLLMQALKMRMLPLLKSRKFYLISSQKLVKDDDPKVRRMKDIDR